MTVVGYGGSGLAEERPDCDLPQMHSKRIVVPVVALVSLFAVFVFYATKVEPEWLRVARYPVAVSDSSAVFVHLTDLHVVDETSLERLERAVSKVEEIRPDGILLTGDYIGRRVVLRERYLRALRRLVAVAPVHCVGGNHDGGYWVGERGGYPTSDTIRSFMQSAGVRYLRNETVRLESKGRSFEIFGAGDVWAGDLAFDPDSVFSSDSTSTKVVMTHNPDTRYRFDSLDWDLMLCGHTHGGQVDLPLIGAPVLPIEDKRFGRGMYRLGSRTLVVSPGVGNLRSVRFGCRPEIGIIEI